MAQAFDRIRRASSVVIVTIVAPLVFAPPAVRGLIISDSHRRSRRHRGDVAHQAPAAATAGFLTRFTGACEAYKGQTRPGCPEPSRKTAARTPIVNLLRNQAAEWMSQLRKSSSVVSRS
jgi:hypothetical protein